MANVSAKASIEKVWFVFLILCVYTIPVDICLWLINTNFYRTYHFVIQSKTWNKFNLNKLWHRFVKSKYKPFKWQFIHILIAKWMMMKAMVFMNVPLHSTEQHKTFHWKLNRKILSSKEKIYHENRHTKHNLYLNLSLSVYV